MKKIGILGSTGSIGSQCLEIIKEHPQQFNLLFITANTNSDKLIEQAKCFKPKYVCLANKDEYLDSYPEGREHFKVQPKFSKEPLSFKELIDLIDSAEENGGLVESAKNCNYEAEIGYELEDVYDFGTAKSAFYPQLEDWYDEVNEEWLKKKKEAI